MVVWRLLQGTPAHLFFDSGRAELTKELASATQKEATFHAWNLLTKVFGLPEDRLYVTYFEGGFGLPPDLETKNFWLGLGVQESRIIPGNAKDNFWGKFSFSTCESKRWF